MTTETIGERLARLRHERGLTQIQLAKAVQLSDSYVSLIESAKRNPSRHVLEILADAVGCTADYLVTGRGHHVETLELELGFAELALRSGDAETARTQFAMVLDGARSADLPELTAAARYGLAMAMETLGDLRGALDGFQALADEPELPATVSRVTVLMMLCRTSMAVGDLTRAVEVGEAAMTEHRASGEPVDETFVELVATLVGCYYERGDVVRAQVLIDGAVDAAEQLGSPRARASAYWNAALVAEGKGDLAAARRLVDRALAIYGELENDWALATLRGIRGRMLLSGDAPRCDEAKALLERALGELEQVGTPGDACEVEADLARCHLLAGDAARAVETAESAVRRAEAGSAIESAKARTVLADALVGCGDVDAALPIYRAAAHHLAGIGASRRAATAWRQLATALTRLGRLDEAVEAYERLADASGVPTPLAPTVVRQLT